MKIKSFFFTAAICGALVFGTVACGNPSDAYTIYAPDGAPALALANAISHTDDKSFDYHIVDSKVIQAQVTGENPKADFCILPINLASKLLGNGETYQMLGTVTNGNLYFLSTNAETEITRENINTVLIGKTVGVVQLSNVPGLTLQAVLSEYQIPYQIIDGVQADKDLNGVNLAAVDAGNVTPVFGCDYYLCPEPAASTKAANTSLVFAGNLQELYGEFGYPQAVLVAKKSVIESDRNSVEKFISYMQESKTYLESVNTQTLLFLLDGKRTQGLTPSFNADNLNAEVIANCSVRFTPSQKAKTEADAFLEKLIQINANSASRVSQSFYYSELP